MRSVGPDGIGTESFLVQEIANHPTMITMAQAFLGKPVEPPRRVRGIYAIFPKPPDGPAKYGPHADYMAAHLAAMVVVDDMPERTGGFTVWPGSHRLLHMHWDTCFGGMISADKADGFKASRDEVLRTITPLEFTGAPGDVIFWHPRLLHSGGIICSASSAHPRVRIIVPCDYQVAGRSYFDDPEYGPGSTYQWWVNTRNFSEDIPPTVDNMWDDWGI